jgi:hypothetical protein
VQVVIEEPGEPDLSQSTFRAADDPVQSPSSLPPPPQSEDDGGFGGGDPGGMAAMGDEPTQAPIVKSDNEKLGRNDPCYCGSGKKFKHCHGQ